MSLDKDLDVVQVEQTGYADNHPAGPTASAVLPGGVLFKVVSHEQPENSGPRHLGHEGAIKLIA